MDDLKKLVRKEKNKHVFERLLFIRQLYRGDTVPQACDTLCIAEQTGYNWLKAWNEAGYEGLEPDFGGGSPPKLTDNQKERVKEQLREKGNWLTQEVKALINKQFNVTYSIRHLARILRDFGMHYAKPYGQDYRKPEDAEALLREVITEAVQDAPKDTVVGFMDEASPQTTDNRQRFWSFGKPKRTRNTSKYRANTFGFYPVNGNESLEFMGNGKSPSVCEFLRKIAENNTGKHIIVFLDNARSHISAETKRFAASHGITLAFIPKYSPQLNPIELIWKSVRRRISQISFIRSEWSFQEAIRTTFHRLARKKSFMKNWLDVFGPEISKLL